MGELGFLNCDSICVFVVNKHFELLEFVVDSVYNNNIFYFISSILLIVVLTCIQW